MKQEQEGLQDDFINVIDQLPSERLREIAIKGTVKKHIDRILNLRNYELMSASLSYPDDMRILKEGIAEEITKDISTQISLIQTLKLKKQKELLE